MKKKEQHSVVTCPAVHSFTAQQRNFVFFYFGYTNLTQDRQHPPDSIYVASLPLLHGDLLISHKYGN